MQRHLLAGLALAALVAAPASAGAQRVRDVPARPRLDQFADSNDARAYYNLGLGLLEREPERANAAFYWAARLNPTFADAYFARRVALHLSDRNRLRRYWSGDRRTQRHAEVQAIDSLYLRALELNPFISTRLEGALQRAIIEEIGLIYERRGQSTRAEIQYLIERDMAEMGAWVRAEQAYYNGNFPDALRLYGEAIRSARRKAWLRTQRGRIFFQLDRADSALTEFVLAREELARTERSEFTFVYESKAMLEHSIGMVHYRKGNVAAAREAFGRAIAEDASFAPAHLQLGYMALEQKDTTAAIAEMELAVQLRENDSGLRYLVGDLQVRIRKLDEAEQHLRKAIELNPQFAPPHAALGDLFAARGDVNSATNAYAQFQRIAPRGDPRLADVQRRLNEFRQGAQPAGAPRP